MVKNPRANTPGNISENVYMESVTVSGNGLTFSSGASGVALTALDGHYIHVWGWQSVLKSSGGGGSGKHLVLRFYDDEGNVLGFGHASDENNLTVSLPQPLKINESVNLNWISEDSDIAAGATAQNIIWYSYIAS